MKFSRVYILLLIFVAASCTKKDSDLSGSNTVTRDIPDDNGCISRVWNYTDFPGTLKEADSLRAIALFNAHGIAYGNLRITNVYLDTVAGDSYVYVNATQYVNGLRLVSGPARFIFRNGTLYESGNRVSATVDLDTISTLRLGQARTLFIANGWLSAAELDKCIEGQFGYFDRNGSIEGTQPHLVKAWKINFADPLKSAPVVYCTDEGEILYVDHGLLVF